MSATPLTAAVFERVPPPSRLEQICRHVPVLGWIAASGLGTKRRLPTFAAIEQVLLDRGKPLFSYPDGSPEALVSEKLLALLEDHGQWEAPNFGPDDEVVVAFASLHYLIEPQQALEEIREYLGLPPIDFWSWDYQNLTFGQLIAELCAEAGPEKFDKTSPFFLSPYPRPEPEESKHESFRLTR